MLGRARCPRQWAGIMPQGQAPSERCKQGEFAGAEGFTVRNRGWTCHGKTAITDAARPRRADADSVSFTPSRTLHDMASSAAPSPASAPAIRATSPPSRSTSKRRGKLGRTDRPDRAAARRPAGTRHPATRDEAWRTGDGFWLLPQLVSAQLSEDGNMRTSTTIQAWHPELAPEGVFEYQHSISNEDAVSAFRRGSQWAATDAVALRDSTSDEPDCPCMIMEFPADGGAACAAAWCSAGRALCRIARAGAERRASILPLLPVHEFARRLPRHPARRRLCRDPPVCRATPTARSARTAASTARIIRPGSRPGANTSALAAALPEFRKQLVIAHLYDGEPG